jgi:hypothetical protein
LNRRSMDPGMRPAEGEQSDCINRGKNRFSAPSDGDEYGQIAVKEIDHPQAGS